MEEKKPKLGSFTTKERDNIYTQLNTMIDMMDEKSINCLFEGNTRDVDKVFQIMAEETDRVMHLRELTTNVDIHRLNYVPEVKQGYEDYLRKANLNYFISSVLPDFELNWHNLEWNQMIQTYRKLCVIASRDHSKSHTFSFAYVLWRLFRYTKPTQLIKPPDDIRYYKEGMLITNEYKLAKRLLKKVKQEIENNPVLRDRLLPDTRSGGWAEISLSCKNQAQLDLSSFGTSNRGPHPGWIVVDDFLDKSCLYSKEQRDKFVEVFQGEIENMLLPQGQILTVGTPFHSGDLYAKLKTAPDWHVFEYPAIFPDGSILWENRYDFKALMNKRKTFGAMIFSREILVKPVSDDTSIFPWEILQRGFVGMENNILVNNRISYPTRFVKVAIGVDLALSARVGADYTVMSVVGMDELNNIHLLHMTRLHGSGYPEQIATLQRLNMDFQPDIIVMETNGFQKVMTDIAREHGINNILEFNTTNKKKDLYEGLPSLAVMFENGVIKLPRGNDHSKATTDILCSELNSIAFDDDTGKLESVDEHDDTAMSLFLGIKGLKNVNSEFKISMI